MAVNVFELFGTIGAKDNATKTIDAVVGKAKEADRTLSKSLKNIGSGATKIGTKLTSFITKPALGAMSALTGITLVKGFGRLLGIDEAKAKLKGLGHEAESIEKIMDSALESVKGTAHGMDEAATTAANAVAAGIKPGQELTKYLTLTGDAAAIAGTSMAEMGSIINKVQTGQTAYTENLEQLSDRGLPIYQWLAEEAGVAASEVKDLASEGEISSEMFLSAIEKNIGGAAKIMGETSFKASIQNIGASISRIGANFLDAGGKGGGFFSTLKPLLADFRVGLEGVEEKAAELGEKFGASFQKVIDVVLDLKSKFDALEPAAQKSLLKTVGMGTTLAVGMGPALKVFGGFSSVLGGAAEKVENFNSFLTKAPGQLGNFASKTSKSIGGFATTVKKGVGGATSWMGKNLRIGMVPLSDFGDGFTKVGAKIKDSKLGGLVSKLGGQFGKLKGPLDKVSGAFGMFGNKMSGAMLSILKFVGPGAIIGVLIAGLGLVNSAFGDQIDGILSMVQEKGPQIVTELGTGIASKIPDLIQQGVSLISNLLTTITTMLPSILSVGEKILVSLVNGVAQNIPQLIPVALMLIETFSVGLLESLPIIIQSGLELIFALVKGVMDNLPQIINTVITIITTFIQVMVDNLPQILKMGIEILFAVINGLIEAIPDLLAALPQIFTAIIDAFKGVDWLQLGKDIINGVIEGIGNMVEKLGESVKKVAGGIKDWFAEKLGIQSPATEMMPIGGYSVEGVQVGMENQQDNLKSTVGNVAGIITGSFTNMTQQMDLSSVTNQGVMIANAIVIGVRQGLGKLPSVGITYMKRFIATMTAQSAQGKIIGIKIGQNVTQGVTSSSNSMSAAGRKMMTLFLNLILSFASKLKSAGMKLIQMLIAGMTSLQSTVSSKTTQMSRDIVKNFEKQGSAMRNAGADLIKKLAQGITSSKSAVNTAMRGISGTMLTAIEKGINGVLGGVNFVLTEVGSSSKVKSWSIPKYAKGTDGHSGGLAMVNDAQTGPYQEAYQTPDGRVGLFPKMRNLLVNMQKGTKVLSGRVTAKLAGVPRYASGVGFNEDVFDYLDRPKELLDKVIGSRVDYKGMVEPWLNMTKAAVKKMTGAAVPFIQKEFDALAMSGDITDTSKEANGVFSYLMAIARKLMAKYGLMFTSGYRPGDPYDHGKGLAVDLALPGVVNGSPVYKAAADDAIRMAGVKYVITNGMWRHKGKGWVPWPDGDHYDHVHISGEQPVASQAGGSVERWRKTVIQALKIAGQYSESNVEKTLYQMKTESGGNLKAINLWDSNAKAGTPSKGLMQVIDPTFKAYAKPPWNKNIYDPLSNILASIRYAVSRYGSLASAYRGVGYANGGFSRKHKLAQISEGNRLESIVPLTKTKRAWEVISQSIGYLVGKGSVPSFGQMDARTLTGQKPTSQETTVTHGDNGEMKEMVSMFKEFIELFKSGQFGVFMDQYKVGMLMAEPNDYFSGQRINLAERGLNI